MKTILLVEDEPIIALAEARQLEGAGYSVIRCGSGERAIEIVDASPGEIDLILMDINLGAGMDGTAAAREILKTRDIPVLFLSSHMEPSIVRKTEEITNYGYVVKSSVFTVLDASIKMALKLSSAKRQLDLDALELETVNESLRALAANLERTNRDLEEANRRLEVSEGKYERLFQLNPDSITLSDLEDGTFIEVNEAFCGMIGRSKDEVIGRSSLDPGIEIWVYPSERKQLMESLRASGEVRNFESTHRSKSGEYFLTEIYSRVIDIDGKEAMLAVVKDVTANKRLLGELHASEERLRLAMDASTDGIWDNDLVRDEAFRSPRYHAMLGYEPGEIPEGQARWRELIHPDDLELYMTSRRACTEGRCDGYDIEIRLRRKDGKYLWTRSRGTVVARDASGRALRMVGTISDISRTKELLNEKDFILREAHHRIKNNMAAIMSFLSLRAEYCSTDEAKEVLKETSIQTRGMISIYERLYVSQDTGRISLDEFLPELLSNSLSLFGMERRVALTMDFGGTEIGAKLATNLAIILNELLTNSMKYAFSGTPDPRIAISGRVEGRMLRIEYSDNGVGLPEGFSIAGSTGFGMTLIDGIASNLGGGIAVRPGSGANFLIEAPTGED
jgi:PAS domain S-box-containing protein